MFFSLRCAAAGPQSRLLVITARIRRRLIGQKLNWISAFAMFDTNGDGVLTPEALTNALTTMHLGLSEGEISELAAGLSSETGQARLSPEAVLRQWCVLNGSGV